MANQFRLDNSRDAPPRCARRGPDVFVEGNRKENVRRLGAAIGDERFIGRALKVGILKVHVRAAVSRRRHIDQASSLPNERRNPVEQNKVAQVIRPVLHFEAIGGVAERCGHHSGISDDHVEPFSLCQQPVGAGTHAFQVGKVEFNQFDASAIGSGFLSHLLSCSPRAAPKTSAPCAARDRAVSTPIPAETPVITRIPFSLQITPDNSHLWLKAPQMKLPQVCSSFSISFY